MNSNKDKEVSPTPPPIPVNTVLDGELQREEQALAKKKARQAAAAEAQAREEAKGVREGKPQQGGLSGILNKVSSVLSDFVGSQHSADTAGMTEEEREKWKQDHPFAAGTHLPDPKTQAQR